MNLENQIEAVLFWKGEPVKIKKLADILNTDEISIKLGLDKLEESLNGHRGLILQRKDDEVSLATGKEVGPIIEKITKEELVKDLGKAGLETLAIIIYKGPVTRAEIDYIRGVQSNFILRNLSIRGLIEKITNPKDQRSFLYQPTFELLSYLGLSKLEEMPELEVVRRDLVEFSQKKTDNTKPLETAPEDNGLSEN